jgi:hypothetical protein
MLISSDFFGELTGAARPLRFSLEDGQLHFQIPSTEFVVGHVSLVHCPPRIHPPADATERRGLDWERCVPSVRLGEKLLSQLK